MEENQKSSKLAATVDCKEEPVDWIIENHRDYSNSPQQPTGGRNQSTVASFSTNQLWKETSGSRLGRGDNRLDKAWRTARSRAAQQHARSAARSVHAMRGEQYALQQNSRLPCKIVDECRIVLSFVAFKWQISAFFHHICVVFCRKLD